MRGAPKKRDIKCKCCLFIVLFQRTLLINNCSEPMASKNIHQLGICPEPMASKIFVSWEYELLKEKDD